MRPHTKKVLSQQESKVLKFCILSNEIEKLSMNLWKIICRPANDFLNKECASQYDACAHLVLILH